jgi:hypothetical protein
VEEVAAEADGAVDGVGDRGGSRSRAMVTSGARSVDLDRERDGRAPCRLVLPRNTVVTGMSTVPTSYFPPMTTCAVRLRATRSIEFGFVTLSVTSRSMVVRLIPVMLTRSGTSVGGAGREHAVPPAARVAATVAATVNGVMARRVRMRQRATASRSGGETGPRSATRLSPRE